MFAIPRRAATVVALTCLTTAVSGCSSTSGSDNSATSTTASAAVTTVSPSPSLTVAEGCQPINGVATSKPQETSAPSPASDTSTTLKATIQTNCGPIDLTLDGAKAPNAVASFVHLTKTGFFDNTTCHRLTTTGIYVLQCGDPTGTGRSGPGYSFGPVENAPKNNSYPAGTLAMARLPRDGNSNGSQFFIVYKDSSILPDVAGGYTVFGNVTNGIDIVRKVADGGLAANGIAPADSISLEKVTVQ